MNNEVSNYIEMWITIFKAMHHISAQYKDKNQQEEYEKYFAAINAHFGIIRDENGNSLGEKFILHRKDDTISYIDLSKKTAVFMVDGKEILHKSIDNTTLHAIQKFIDKRAYKIDISKRENTHNQQHSAK